MAIYTVGVGQDYINLAALAAAEILVDGDEIHLSGTVDDSASGNIIFPYYAALTFKKKTGDASKPVLLMGASSVIYCYYGDGVWEDIIFRSSARVARKILTAHMGTAIVTRCDFYDDDYLNGDPSVAQFWTADVDLLVTDCRFYNLAGPVLEILWANATFDKCIFENVARVNGALGAIVACPLDEYNYNHLTLTNNIFKHIGSSCIYLAGGNFSDLNINKIINNTFYSFGEVSAGFAFVYSPTISDPLGENVLYNNIIHGNGNANTTGISVSVNGKLIQDYNCIHGCTIEYAGIAASAVHNIDSINAPGATDPDFTNVGIDDFTLQDASPCIDTGAGTGVYAAIPVVDFTGNARPLAPGAGWDMGAYERAIPEAGPWLVGDVVGADYATLRALCDSGLVVDGDIVELSGTVDDSASGNIDQFYYTDVTFRKRPADENKPIVLLGASGRISVDYATITYENIIFRCNGRISGPLLRGGQSTFNMSGCEFYDDNYAAGDVNGFAINTGDATGWYISNCLFENFAASAIVASGGLQSLDSCTFKNVGLIYDKPAVYDIDGNASCIIKNNVFNNVGGGVLHGHIAGGAIAISVLNNTIFGFGSVHANSVAIAFDSEYIELYIYNNVIHGDSNATTTAINIAASVQTVEQDYNCIHGCTIEYAGIAASAAHNIDSTNNPGATDPLFTNAASSDFTLQDLSPCIDAGAGTGVYTDIPIVDIIDNTRPLAPLAGWDIGAYERGLTQLPSIYFINASGSSTSPYDTPEKGAINFAALTASVTLINGDTIEVVNDGDVDDSGAPISIDVGVTIRSYGTNGTNRLTSRPTVILWPSDYYYEPAFYANGSIIQGLKFKRTTGGGTYLKVDDSIIIVDSCEFYGWTNDPQIELSLIHSVGLDASCVIKNCKFFNAGCAIILYSYYDITDCDIFNNSMHDCHKGINISADGDVNNCNVINNIISASSISANSYGVNFNSPVGSNNIVKNNCIYNYTNAILGSIITEQVNNITVNPLYVNPNNFDLHLQDLSPCIDTGAGTSVNPNIPVVDTDGNVRPLALLAGWDIGAYERALPEETGPQIDVQPLSQQVSAHTNVTFTVEASGGTAPLSYQWKKDGSNITGATNSTLLLNSVTDNSQGAYTVIVTDTSEESVESDEAQLIVNIAPLIVIQPIVIYADHNSTVVLQVTVQGDVDVPMVYKWTKAGVIVSNNSVLVIDKLKKDNAGTYLLIVSNEFGSDESEPIDVRIYSGTALVESIMKESTKADHINKVNNILMRNNIIRSRGLLL